MPRFHPLKIREIRQETSDCVSVAFELPESLREEYAFTQGQYLTLKTELKGEEVRRTYSICSSPVEEELRVAIKQVPGGLFSTYANEQLAAGAMLDVMTPLGNFHTRLDPENEKQYIAFAAGSGITPIMSIMKAVLAIEPKSAFTLFYGNRRSDSIIFLEEIEGLKNRHMDRLTVYHILSREHTGSELFSGRITAEKCGAFFEKVLDPKEADDFFICGPFDMMQSIRAALEARGVDRKRIHVELFTSGNGKGPGKKKKLEEEQTSVQSLIQVTLDGSTFEFPLISPEDTILDAAIKGGADLPFACKGGVCATCKAKLMEGKVEMEVNYALEPEEVDAGYILTCQSHPRTEKVAVDFDA